jgi:acyl transferase domain-containing protein
MQWAAMPFANSTQLGPHRIASPLRLLGSLVDRAIEAGASNATILATSVPSHIPQLAPASLELLALAGQMTVQAPNQTMFSNRHARPITTAEGVREEVALNMANRVRWNDIMTALGGLETKVVLESPRVMRWLNSHLRPYPTCAFSQRPRRAGMCCYSRRGLIRMINCSL